VTASAGVPFLDLSRSHAPIKAAFLEKVSALVDSNAFINGPDVAAFENSFAAYCGTADSVGLASGLDALRLALSPSSSRVARWSSRPSRSSRRSRP